MSNNHSIDQGRDGLLDTMAALEGAGLVPLGAGRSQREARRHHLMVAGGMKVALLAYVAIIIEGVAFLEDLPAAAQLQEETVGAEIAAARAEADIVIVTIHWGTEYRSEPSDEQRRLGRMLIDAGAELVLGHPPVYGSNAPTAAHAPARADLFFDYENWLGTISHIRWS